ncbi:mechanosensitive ion channel family protein [Caproiciproducens sp. NJN-50]|uniref:mechanosensitive ion channel family protein n=1 Tax=Acutalibacteraceae TaxID=3082771 RepID=UPI000FFE3092|nr:MULTISPECIES: mechanosensitive ion channel family protein [Acutalibacteraceae]QAT48715.1 mechanosensitive ion channel family protein [Caproiciproducens sp. NJN-50]
MSLPNIVAEWKKIAWVADFAIPLAVFLFVYFLRGTAVNWMFRPVKRLNAGKKWPVELECSFQKPLRALIGLLGLYGALWISPAVPHSGAVWEIVVKCFRSLLILLLAWGFGRLCSSRELAGGLLLKKLDVNTDGVLFPFLSKILRFLIFCLALLIVAQEWNYSISGLLAGLGLGGLAFALAAQDMLSNLFGGLVIFLDRPFAIGDWIQAGDVEGTVESINFRSVKVRTFSQAVVTVPNSKMVDRPVANYSRMGKRKVSFTVGLRFGTTEGQIRSCVDRIRAMLLANEEIDPETVIVTFSEIGKGSLDLMLYFFTKTTDWQKHLKVREDIHYGILRILEEEKTEIALPASTVRLEREE